MKYVAVIGGGVKGHGTDVTAVGIGVLLQACGLRVTAVKIDPYLSVKDQCEYGDLTYYEKFLDIKLTPSSKITNKKINKLAIHLENQRKRKNLDKPIQTIGGFNYLVRDWIERVAMVPVDGEGPPDVCLIQLGCAIVDQQSAEFLDALTLLSHRVGAGSFCVVHVSLISHAVNTEQLTGPAQYYVRSLRQFGLITNILACRCTEELKEDVKQRLSAFCHVPLANIFSLYYDPNIRDVLLPLLDQKAHEAVLNKLNLQRVARDPKLDEWMAGYYSRDAWEDRKRQIIKVFLIRRMQLAKHFTQTNVEPEWMVLCLLPVLPPELRPIVYRSADKVVTSGINELYKRVVCRNNNLAYLLKKSELATLPNY